MTLAQLVQPHIALTDAEIVALLNAPSVTVTDSQRWTWAGLALEFDAETISTIDEILKAIPGMGWVRIQLGGSGIDFSLDVTQAALESMRAVPAMASYVDALKAIGVRQISPFQEAGFEGEVTLEEVATVHADLVTRAAAGAYWSRVLAVVNPMIDAGDSAEEIKAAAVGVV